MIIKEIQILSEGLWESVKTDLKYFSSIQLFVKKLAELDFSEVSSIDEAHLYIQKIEMFFDKYRRQPSDTLYFPSTLITLNDDSVKKIEQLISKLKTLEPEELGKEIDTISKKKRSIDGGHIFIGHGRSKLWARVQIFLKDELKLKTLTFEDESRTSETIINILENFLEISSFAILIMTAEDETADGKIRARQNVIHEAGLFQGRLGFNRVIILKEEGVEEFSNIAGLQYISFSKGNIEQTFYDLQRKFKKMQLIN